jgi:AcrR family transcriptional regulator
MARIRDEMKRNRIIETAKSLFAKKGFAACSISDIVEESGLSVGAIYTYFKGKEDILRAIVDEGWLQFYDSLAGIMRSSDSPARKLSLLIHRFIPDLLEDVDLVHLVLTEASGLTGLREKVDILTDLLAEQIGELFDTSGFGSRFPRSAIRTAIVVLFLGITNTALLARTARLGVSLQEVLEFLKTTVETSLGISLDGEAPA